MILPNQKDLLLLIEATMAAFKEHVNIATIVVGVVVITLYSSNLLTLYQTLVALFIGIMGGILPDIDSNHSKPLQGVFKIFSIIVPLLILLSFFHVMSVLKTILLWILFALLLRITLFKFFLHLTHHRGIFHSIPMAILVGELTLLFTYYTTKIDLKVSVIYGFIIFFGFIIHLLLDEIYSIDAFGIKMKKSFGTALKLYDKQNIIGTLIIYFLIILIYFFLPDVHTIIIKLFHTISNIKLI